MKLLLVSSKVVFYNTVRLILRQVLKQPKIWHVKNLRTPTKSGLEIIAHQSLQTILDAFVPLTMPHKSLSFKEQRLMSILNLYGARFSNNHYSNIMQVLDIISKFSDHQAYSLAQELQGNKIGLF